MRVQLDFDPQGLKMIEELKKQTGLRTHKDLFNNALTILSWAVHQRMAGRTGAAVYEQNEKYRDLQMPVLGGVDAAKEIRGHFMLPMQPLIIAMTGHALTGVKESCMEVGMDDFMTKPVSIDDLRKAIERNYPRLRAA